jgi:serine protease AprX
MRSPRRTATTRTWFGWTLCLAVLLVAGGAAGIAIASGSVDDRATIAPEVTNAEGEQVVIVHVESERVVAGTGETTVEALKERAESGQAPLERYAGQTPGVTIENSFWLGNLAVVTIDHDRADVTELAAVQNVDHVGPNFEVSLDATASDVQAGQASGSAGPSLDPAGTELFERPGAIAGPGLFDRLETIAGLDPEVEPRSSHTTYGLDQINATEVWNRYDTKGEGITVAVLDTGVDPDHQDISLDKWQEWDSNGNPVSTSPKDYGTHGTHVSGTVTGGNASGTHIGVAPNATLHHGAVLPNCNQRCTGSIAQVVAGMEWAADNGVDVMSLSLGAPGFSFDGLISPVRDAHSVGTIVVAAAGNFGEGTSDSPGNVYDSVAVGASDRNEDIWSSSAGETVDTDADWGSSAPADWPEEYIVPTIAAPGAGVYSAEPGNTYGYKSGTSMATPHVSGAIALLQSATERNLGIGDIEDVLIQTAWKPPGEPDGQDTRYGHGIIDVEAAIDAITQSAYFATTIDGTNSPVTEGERLDVTTTVQNTGNETATQAVTLSLNGTERDSTNVTLDAGNATTVTLSAETGDGDAGTYTATVESENTSDSTDVTVNAGANFSVAIDSTNSPVLEGDPLQVDATIQNTGGTAATRAIELAIDGTVVNSPDETLDSGQSTAITLQWTTSADDSGNYTATVSSPADTDTSDVTVRDPTLGDYANNTTGVVEIGGVFGAIADWRNGIVDTMLLLNVIDAWRSGDPVT